MKTQIRNPKKAILKAFSFTAASDIYYEMSRMASEKKNDSLFKFRLLASIILKKNKAFFVLVVLLYLLIATIEKLI